MAANSESQSSTSNLVPATSLAQEDQILVVEIEKTPKKKFLKRALDFIEKCRERGYEKLIPKTQNSSHSQRKS